MQNNLSGKIEPIGLTVEDAAAVANVSSATIRNWIKTGYLRVVKKGVVDKISFDVFMRDVAGKEKLTSRANKLQKDEHNHIVLSDLVKNKLRSDDWRGISEKYEQSLSNSYRNREGVYYTPSKVVMDMLKGVEVDEKTIFLDPCCGSGNFILEAINIGVKPENVFGFDIDKNAVEITKKRVFDATGYASQNNIKNLDFLENAEQLSRKIKYDLIFTNPPWGKKIKKKERMKYGLQFGAGKSLDTTSLFYFAAMRLLKDGGKLGFLVQDALFNISTFQNVRGDILEYKILRLIDYGKVFKGLMTKAQAFMIEKEKASNNNISCENIKSNFLRQQNSFYKNPKQILNFWIDNEAASVIDYIYNLPHKTLKNNAKWALGIVTGNNSKFFNNTPKSGDIPIYKGSDITRNGLKNVSTYIPSDFSKYHQTAPLEMYKAPKKIIYKFISSKLLFYYDTEQKFILNSANILIPNIGISCKQLTDLLNSDFINWLFHSLFRTHKILRGDIELLPIHIDYFKKHKVFSEKTYLAFLGLAKQIDEGYRCVR